MIIIPRIDHVYNVVINHAKFIGHGINSINEKYLEDKYNIRFFVISKDEWYSTEYQKIIREVE